MRLELKFLITEAKTDDGKTLKKALFDGNGQEVSIDAIVRKVRLRQNEGVPVLFILDDGLNHEICEFNLQEARKIIGSRIKGAYICTFDGRKVTVDTTTANGKYPLYGMDANDYPCKWDKDGNAEDGDEYRKLYIAYLKPEEEKKEKEVPQKPAKEEEPTSPEAEMGPEAPQEPQEPQEPEGNDNPINDMQNQ